MKINKEHLNTLIKESIVKALNENAESHPIVKWIYWCMDYDRPEQFIEAMVGSQEHHLYQHFLSKFNSLYKRVGPDGVMNRFFLELDGEYRQRLLDYVEQRKS